MRRVIIHNYLPAYDERLAHYKPYRTDEFMFTGEVDRGRGQGFQREHTMAKSAAEAEERFKTQFGSWSKVRNVKQSATK